MKISLRHSCRRTVIILGIALFSLPGLCAAEAKNADSAADFIVSSAAAPEGAENLNVQWLKVSASPAGEMLLAVAKPQGKGPFPTILLLHGTHGFAREYVQLAQALAREGVLAVAACWFASGTGSGVKFITPLGCSGAQSTPPALSDTARKTVGILVEATQRLPNVAPGPIALFGHSRGGGAVLNYVRATGNARAAILNSTGYPAEVTSHAAQIKVPLLILHGVADSPAQGGSEFTHIQMARNFESALRSAGKPVEVMYYEGANHNGLFEKPSQAEDSIRRISAFVKRYAQH